MQRLLCTIGFTGKTAEEFFSLLSGAAVQQVIDIRVNRGGQLSGFSKHPDFSFFLRRIGGIEYLHEPQLAPPPDLLKRYRQSKDWIAYEVDFLAAMRERGVPESLDTSSWQPRISLLCSEPGPEKCHRRLVAELLAAFWRERGDSVETQHLVVTRENAKNQHRKATGYGS